MAEGGGPACGDGQQPQPPALPQQPMDMNWSHFKPEFSGKPDEDVEAHLLRTNDWRTTHDFPEVVKVQRFCLMLCRAVHGRELIFSMSKLIEVV